MNKKNLLLLGSIFVLQSTMAQVLQRHNNAYKPDDKIEKQQVEFKKTVTKTKVKAPKLLSNQTGFIHWW